MQNENLAKSCSVLIKTNNGLFKSNKQKWFFIKQLEGCKTNSVDNSWMNENDIGVVITEKYQFSGKTFVTLYILDNEGVREQKTLWWGWVVRPRPAKEVYAEYAAQSFRARECNAGLEQEEIEGIRGWEHKTKWIRS